LLFDRVGEDDQIPHLSRAIADVVGQQRLGFEAQAAEHRDQRGLIRDHLDDELPQPHVDRFEHCLAGQETSDAAAPLVGIDDQPHLTHVARPADQAHDRQRADDGAVVDGDDATRPGLHPILKHARIAHVLLEEGPVALRDALEELRQRRFVAGLDWSYFHGCS